MEKTTQIVLHIPHASDYVPCTDGYVAGREDLINEITLLTDWFTDELFDLPYARVIAPFSRVFCDVERFPDDSSEVMSRCGMGMCYTHFDDGKLMRNVSPELKNKIKSLYYDQHHKWLESAVEKSLSENGKALIIDCHSFPDIPPNRDLQRELPRPDFCIGTDDFHTPENIADQAYEFIASRGLELKFNNPYSGTMIPMKYFKKDSQGSGNND